MGNQGSVQFMYDHNAVVGVRGATEEDVLETLIEASIDVDDIETENDTVVVYADPTLLYAINDALSKMNVVASEIAWVPKEMVNLSGEDLDIVRKLLGLLDDIDDVQNVYHNVENI